MLEVIHGGLLENAGTSRRVFNRAYVINTRLMGVVGVYSCFELPDNSNFKRLHQFFYFDAEEFGFDNYESVLEGAGDCTNPEVEIENRLFGGLGGAKVDITEKELRYLVRDFVDTNISQKIPLPDKYNEYRFLIEPRTELSYDEEKKLFEKQCCEVQSPYEVINYFIMRCVGRDFKAARFLTKGTVKLDVFKEHKAATLVQNTIDPDNEDGSNASFARTGTGVYTTFDTLKSYMCNSLIEYDGDHYILTTRVTLDGLKVVKYERKGSFGISIEEAGMITQREEHVTLFEYMGNALSEISNDTPMTRKSMVTDYDTGKLFMIFKPNNNHVRERVFKLNNDVQGIYYITESNQIILAAYSEQEIESIEMDLLASRYGNRAMPVSKYCFRQPVLFDFIMSGADDFEEFVDFISEIDD